MEMILFIASFGWLVAGVNVLRSYNNEESRPASEAN
jgi:hypothetical protein